MKDNSGNIKQYSAEDIRRYLQDEMSPGEMHAIEKAALDDPFLADAIEGFSTGVSAHGLATVEKSAEDLQTAFAERINQGKKRNVVPVVKIKSAPPVKMRWWQAAVAASIIITAAVLGYRSYNERAEELLLTATDNSNNTKPGVTTSDSVRPQTTTITSDSTPPQASTSEPLTSDTIGDIAGVRKSNDDKKTSRQGAQENSANTNKTKQNDALAAEANALMADEKAIAANQRSAKNDQLSSAKETDSSLAGKTIARNEKAGIATDKESVTAKRVDAAAMPLKKAGETEFKKEEAMSMRGDSSRSLASGAPTEKLSGKVAGVDFDNQKARNNQSTLNYFNGQIVTSDNKPLSNAVLKLSNNPTVYTTDNNGKFRIASPDSVIEVEASMIGKETTRFRLQKDEAPGNLLLADAANTLDEVVVIGYGTQKKKDFTGSVTVSGHEAEPQGGWLAWENYLQANKDSSLMLNGSAETELVFQVNAKNTLSNFKITRSVSAKHDKEVIRLIKEGPKWKLLKGKKARVTITVKF